MWKNKLLLTMALFCSSCGYQLLTTAPLACQELFIAPVNEGGQDVGLALPLREQLARQLAARGQVLAVSPKGAACTLHARVNKLSNSMSGSGYGEQKVNSFTQSAAAECWISGPDGKTRFHSGSMKLQEIYLASPDLGSSQVETLVTESARRRNIETLASKLAAECLERAEEKWLQ